MVEQRRSWDSEELAWGLFCGVDEDDDDGFHYRILSSSSSVSSPLRLPPVGLPFFPAADFLSSCYLCKKKLHGGDIYMYRGEKAFCSMECRGRQMVAEQLQENCSSEASKPPSDYAAGGLFCTGSAPA
ncbi:unnamed protein product [Spirodela intermedia]|uniref:FLZ-type domain-containing protein n=1 Tax=Spirodela intermedia TaxID=51605 RepID=A0A7I8J5C5_SPIIN|nr:unnamed protein product [Spirodela intermedia]CAA6664621.1 unnamed protein product [Spirodela intermedia]